MNERITNFHKVQVRTRGIIPVIMKRGPLAEIELDESTILELVVRGVDIVSVPDGTPITLTYFAKKASKPAVEKTPEVVPVTVPEKVDVPTSITVNVPVPEEEVADATPSVDFAEAGHTLVQSESEKADIEIASSGTAQQPMSKNQMKKARRAAAQAAQDGQNHTNS